MNNVLTLALFLPWLWLGARFYKTLFSILATVCKTKYGKHVALKYAARDILVRKVFRVGLNSHNFNYD